MGRFSRVRCSPLPVLFFRGDGGEEGVRKGQVRQRAPCGVVSVGGPEEGPRCPPTSRRTAAPYPILKSRSFGHDKPTVRIFIICNLRREIRLVKPTTWRLEYTHDVYRVPHRFFHFERGKSSSGFHLLSREREVSRSFSAPLFRVETLASRAEAFCSLFERVAHASLLSFFFSGTPVARRSIASVSVKGDESG